MLLRTCFDFQTILIQILRSILDFPLKVTLFNAFRKSFPVHLPSIENDIFRKPLHIQMQQKNRQKNILTTIAVRKKKE